MDALLVEVAKRCSQTAASDRPKYRRLMMAIQDTITSGIIGPGDRFPTEKEIASTLPFALGTIQKALNGLVTQGLLNRSRRSGTFVSDLVRPLNDMSQFVFERADGSVVDTVMTEITDITKTSDPGEWASLLGRCSAGYVRIVRTDRIDSNFYCYVEMHLRADTYSDLLTEAPNNLSGRNIRTILENRYDVVLSNLEITVAATAAPRRVTKHLKLNKDSGVLQISIAGYDDSHRAHFTQTAYAPAGSYRVKFRSDVR